VAGAQHLRLALAAALPHRTDGVDDVPRRQPSRGRGLRPPGLAAAEPPALLEDRRPAGAVDRSVDAAAAEQRAVRGVHDRVRRDLRDVADHRRDHGGILAE
jgi:hypothetical protein